MRKVASEFCVLRLALSNQRNWKNTWNVVHLSFVPQARLKIDTDLNFKLSDVHGQLEDRHSHPSPSRNISIELSLILKSSTIRATLNTI